LGGTSEAAEPSRNAHLQLYPLQGITSSTVIEVRRSYPPEQATSIVEAVHAALVEGFKIPDEDRCVRLVIA